MTPLAAAPPAAVPRASEPEHVVAFHENGAVRERAVLVDGAPHGVVEQFDPAGRPVRRARCREGVLDGEAVDFDERGRPSLRAEYRAGRLHGEVRSYEEGVLRFSCQYLMGMKDGESRTWAPDGTPGALMRYRADVAEGRWEWYDARGRVLRTAEYRAGVLHGDVLDYGPDGTLRERTPHAAGLPHGGAVAYHPNGKPMRRQRFRGGKPAGEAVWYDARGRETRPPPASTGELPRWRRVVLRITGRSR